MHPGIRLGPCEIHWHPHGIHLGASGVDLRSHMTYWCPTGLRWCPQGIRWRTPRVHGKHHARSTAMPWDSLVLPWDPLVSPQNPLVPQ